MSAIRADVGGAPWTRWQYLGAAALTAGFVAGEVLCEGATLVAAVPANARSELYVSLAASSAALLGFSITAATVLLMMGSGPRILWLRKQEAFKCTRVVFMMAIRALAAATLYFTLLIITDTDATGRLWLEAPGVLIGAFVIARLGIVIWLVGKLLDIALLDGSDAEGWKRNFSEGMHDNDEMPA